MKQTHPRTTVRTLALAAAVAGIVSPSLHAATTGWDQTAGGSYDYNTPGNWVGGNVNGIWDASLTLAATQTVTFGADTVLSTGLDFNYDGGFNVTLTGSGNRTLTLGGDINVNTVSNTRTINLGASAGSNLNVDLGGVTRTFNVGTGRSLGFVNVVSNGGIIANGGTVNFSGANTYSGATTVNSGNLSLNGTAGSAANSDITVNSTGTTTLTFNSNSGSGTLRAKSVTLNGSGAAGNATASLAVAGNSGANSIDSITNALTFDKGFARVAVTPNASRNARLTANSLVVNGGAVAYFRGTNLGVNTIASQTANSSNIVFTNAPTLVGGAGATGTSTVSILPRSYGAIVANTDIGQGLVTYDSTNGVRLLSAGEYATGMTDGQSALTNALFARASGGASQDINLTAATTTVNSLSFRITGAGTNSGVTISGDAGTTLKVNSGTIFASQQVTTAAASDAMTVSVPKLDLNGREGTVITFANGFSNSNTVAPLYISSEITNDGGNGLTFGGSGQTIFTGSVANTYTGVTTLNSGVLRLDRVGVDSLTGDLVINGGTLLKRSNAIADTASITINSGAFVMDSSTSSGNNGHAETINNFTMNGGAVGNSSGTNSALTINGNATINAKQLGLQQGGDIVVLGQTSLNGGLIIGRESSSDTVRNGLLTLNTVAITNPASGPYTAIRLNAHATRQGSLFTLKGDLSFTGNLTNTNRVLIETSDASLANQGVMALDGTRTLNIGNGAASVDLQIVPAIINGTATGGLTKTGAGTLLLTGVNTYTGPTSVSGGTLIVGDGTSGSLGATAVTVSGSGTLSGSGSIAGSVAVNSGGTLSPGNSPGILNTGSLTLASGGQLAVEANGTSVGTQYDQVNVTGSVSLAGDLAAVLGYAPTIGDKLFIIDNDASDAVVGGFANLGVGNTIDLTYSATLYRFVVSYVGDFGTNSATGGNDVVLTNVVVPEPGMLAVAGIVGAGLLRRRRGM